MLNAARIAERKNRPRATKDVEIGGDTIRIRKLNLHERDDYNLSVLDEDGKVDPGRLRGNKARLIAACVINDEGQLFLSEAEIVAAFDVDEIDELNDACSAYNGLSKAVVEKEAGNS